MEAAVQSLLDLGQDTEDLQIVFFSALGGQLSVALEKMFQYFQIARFLLDYVKMYNKTSDDILDVMLR